jgi:hypothetical protein
MGTRWDRPALRLVDGDPEQTERVRTWRAAHPEWTLEHHGHKWSWTNGQGKREFYSLGDALGWTDLADPGTGLPPSPSLAAILTRGPAGAPPDILA